jgi:hypothetical protein
VQEFYAHCPGEHKLLKRRSLLKAGTRIPYSIRPLADDFAYSSGKFLYTN